MALPLCGLARLGKPWRRARQGRGFYPRYPRYPQAESAWSRPNFHDSFRCGRDDLPATEDSLPSHSPSGCPAGRLRAAGQAEAKGRAADEAAARRTMAGLPFSGCESGRLRRSAHPEPSAFGPGGTGQAGHRTFGFRTCPAESGTSVSAPPPAENGLRPGSVGQDRVSARELRTGGPRISVHGPPGGTEASAEDPAGLRNRGFGLRNREGGNGSASSESAERRTARASALSGSPRGNRRRLRPWMDPGGSGA